MGGRDLPVECEHGVTIDGGDFTDSQECEACNTASDDLTAEELRRLSDMVQFGECVTFPNGVTIDKRPLAWPSYQPTYTPSNPNRCGLCGAAIPNGAVHVCGSYPTTYPRG